MNTLIQNLIENYKNSNNNFEYFNSLNYQYKSLILYFIENKFKIQILNKLDYKEIVKIFEYLDPDEITDILQILSKKKQKKIIFNLKKIKQEKINYLLKFAPDSAAGIMSLNYIIISNEDSKNEVLNRLKKHLLLRKKEPTILVIDNNNNFLGELRISTLLFVEEKELFNNLKKIPSIIYNKDQEEVIDIFRKNKHEKVIVFDELNNILGVIKAKDLFKVIDDEYTEDYYGLAGLDKEEDISDNIATKVKFRIGWLIINLFTAFLAAYVVTLYQDTISKYVILAAFMPIIAGMGGNAGTQTTAILIRSLALKKINSNLIKKIIFSEIFAGFINGLIIGFIVGGIGYIFNNNILFGIIAMIAIIGNLIIAGFFGTIIPLILKSLNYDPAAASTVFVTTATDVLGFFIFLGLAKLIL